ncbi:polysaccharide deacetylase family protein [Lapidilactobacillus gannanensis]|uniref:Polysaccharide deacetylase family protein n=1 Tax=Lapidilactobacillus gannanensis TaxID=2486002 RepID=A0ABW4BNH8_9LACO|nr:polysaccharide deacetylase family protein [Lapidilactobacillus gannanensis]
MKRRSIYLTLLVLIGLLGFFEIRRTAQTIRADQIAKPAYTYDNLRQNKSSGIAVLCYHRILNNTKTVKLSRYLSGDEQLHMFNVPLDQFAAQMRYLKQQQIKVISIAEMLTLMKQGPIQGKYVVITFDDIDRSLLDNAVPTLKKYRFPFTAFVITGMTAHYIDGSQMASWNQIADVAATLGATIGLHTHDQHYQVGGKPILADLTKITTFKKDYRKSQQLITKKILAEPARYFAYPYGKTNRLLSDYMINDGIQAIFTLDGGLVKADTDLAALPRYVVNQASWDNIKHWLES